MLYLFIYHFDYIDAQLIKLIGCLDLFVCDIIRCKSKSLLIA